MERRLKDFFTLRVLKTALVVIPKMIFTIINWPEFLLNYIGFSHTEKNMYLFRNGMTFKTNNQFDTATIASVILRKDYGNVNHNDVVIDIGANIGTFSIMATKQGAKVYSYEPMPDTYKLFTDNVLLSNVNINTFNLGISDKNTTKKLYLNNTGGSVFNSMYVKQKKSININCISLDDVFKMNNITHCDVLKCDVEGGEYDIFYGASKSTLKKIRQIRMEYHNVKTNKDVNDLITFLENAGFTVIKRREDNNFSGILWLEQPKHL